MIIFIMFLVFVSVFGFIIGLVPMDWENRPRLQMGGFEQVVVKKKKSPFSIFKKIAVINRGLTKGALSKRVARDLSMGHVDMSPEEFFLVKELVFIWILIMTFRIIQPDMIPFWILMSFAAAYLAPEYWLKAKIKRIKSILVKELPDAIDLLRLCVNAGLDFMLALKWVVEKSPPSVMVKELHTVMQEINLGKTRRDAIRDLASKYELPDLSTLARTLIQADKMGTSVAEALNILSEDMRLSRFRRGEQLALKAPLKMLIPLLLFIFPVVGILVAGPILLDFIENNPMAKLGAG